MYEILHFIGVFGIYVNIARNHTMATKRLTSSHAENLESSPPFLPLEESMRSRSGTECSIDGNNDDSSNNNNNSSSKLSNNNSEEEDWQRRSKAKVSLICRRRANVVFRIKSRIPKLDGKTLVLIFIAMVFAMIIWDAVFVPPQDRFLRPDFSDKFLEWVQSHPGWGLGAIGLVIAGAVVSMVPIGTPLTLGCGYIYRGVYGWKLGLFVATLVSMAGSALGAVICFLLGRYLMRDQVKKWVRKYPVFDAIDVGKSDTQTVPSKM